MSASRGLKPSSLVMRSSSKSLFENVRYASAHHMLKYRKRLVLQPMEELPKVLASFWRFLRFVITKTLFKMALFGERHFYLDTWLHFASGWSREGLDEKIRRDCRESIPGVTYPRRGTFEHPISEMGAMALRSSGDARLGIS